MRLPHARHLRYRSFSRVRHQRKMLAKLTAEGVRLTGSVSTTEITASHITEEKAVGTLTFGANASPGETVDIAAQTYTFVTALTEAKASGDLVTDNTNAADGSSVVIGAVTYTFQDTAVTPGSANAVHVLIGADADASLLNLARAINNSGGTPGTDYDTTGTGAHPVVGASTSVTSHTITLTATDFGTAGNIATTASTSPDSHIDPEAATLTGGLDIVDGEVVIGTGATDSLDNLIAAINGDAGEGTTYATDTVANAMVTAAAGAGDTMDIEAIEAGAEGNAIAVSTDVTDASWDDAHLSGGVTESFGPDFTASSHGISHGEGPYVVVAAEDSGLSTSTLYWVSRIDANTLALARTRSQAVAGDYVAIAGNTPITIKKPITSEGMFNVLKQNKPELVEEASDIDALA